MTNVATGQQAETAAAEYLQQHGYTIIERNFRTPRCEIDIVARQADCIYFVEVKYRQRTSQGSGLDYITRQKQQQMLYAAEVWRKEHDWTGEVTLSAMELSGPNFQIDTFIESLV